MSVLKDAATIANDTARIWADILRYRFEDRTKSIKRAVIRFIVEVMLVILALVFVGIGIGLIITACRVFLADALGNGPGTLLIGAIVTVAALIVALATITHSRS